MGCSLDLDKRNYEVTKHFAKRKTEMANAINITKEDGLPTKLCELCSKTLAITHKFKTSCQHSDDLFRNIINKQNLPQNEVKIEIDEVVEVPSNELKYQELQTKEEVDTDNDDYNNFLGNIAPDPTTITRLKVKSKKKIDKNAITRNKKKISKHKIYEFKPKERNKDKGNLDLREEKSKALCCPLCDIKFNSTEERIEHRRVQHGDCEWICEICGKKFKNRSSHTSHVRSHQPPKFQCLQCDYMAWHRADMDKHLKMHKGIRDYVCEYCTKSFGNTSNLRDHIRRHHLTSEKKHVCPRCGRAFFASDKLRRHLDTHDNIKRFQCEVCEDRFSRRCQWKIHLSKMHNISIPRARPGPRKSNVLVGVKDPTAETEKLGNNCNFNRQK